MMITAAPSKRLVAVLLALGIPFVIGWQIWSNTREPGYQGKRLTVWLDEGCENFDWAGPNTEEAIRAMGKDAIPTLLHLVSTRDSAYRRIVIKLSRDYDSFPVHLRNRDRLQQMGAFGFRVLGDEARPAVPALIKLLDDRDLQVRMAAEYSLAVIGPPSRPAVPVLTKLLTAAASPSSDAGELGLPAYALGEIGPAATSAVPQLSALDNNSYAGVRPAIRVALAKINGNSLQPILDSIRNSDPANQSNVSQAALTVEIIGSNAVSLVPWLIDALGQTNTSIQSKALTALARIRCQPDLYIPTILPLLKSTNASVRSDAIKAIGSIASGGKPPRPTPELVPCLNDLNDSVRATATNVLREADPETATKAGVH